VNLKEGPPRTIRIHNSTDWKANNILLIVTSLYPLGQVENPIFKDNIMCFPISKGFRIARLSLPPFCCPIFILYTLYDFPKICDLLSYMTWEILTINKGMIVLFLAIGYINDRVQRGQLI